MKPSGRIISLKKPWKSYFRRHGRQRSLGYHATKWEAAAAYNKAALKAYGPTAWLNPIRGAA